MLPLLVTIPHSGEKVPPQASWLQNLPEPVLMCDVDRYVDWIYEPSLGEFKIPFVKTEWHRYAGDLNRLPEDVDMASVKGNANPGGLHNRGFLWQITTTELPLMTEPIEPSAHQELVNLIYEPFHRSVREEYENLKRLSGGNTVYHIDAHSMPSVGTRQHRDPGERRADIVISDNKGKSCSRPFRDLVIAAYVTAGFKVGYNWPYFGGRVTEQYGSPESGHEVLQVELNRDLYMDETTKKLKPEPAEAVQKKVRAALEYVVSNLAGLRPRT